MRFIGRGKERGRCGQVIHAGYTYIAVRWYEFGPRWPATEVYVCTHSEALKKFEAAEPWRTS